MPGSLKGYLSWIGRGIASVVIVALVAGGCEGDGNAVPAVSDERTPVAEADLADAWTRGDVTSFALVATTGPHRVSDHALEKLREVMTDQAGLDVNVVAGQDTGLAAQGVLDAKEVSEAGWAQIPAGNEPAAVLVVVQNTDHGKATFGFIRYRRGGQRTTAVIVLHRGPMSKFAVGPISRETIEATVLVHEVGHWLGVPARDHHRSAASTSHCTHARCVMFKGIKQNPVGAVLANLRTGIPLRFCPDCAEELAEMRRRRQAQRP